MGRYGGPGTNQHAIQPHRRPPGVSPGQLRSLRPRSTLALSRSDPWESGRPAYQAEMERAMEGAVGFEVPGYYELCQRYSLAIPTVEALDEIRRFSPDGVVEIGAGTGYWARLLEDRGVEVAAFDLTPPDTGANSMHPSTSPRWCGVEPGNAAVAADFPDRTLLLCWPPLNDPMAAEALASYGGATVAYVGESSGGATADDRFHEVLYRRWQLASSVDLPTWPMKSDYLSIWTRRERQG